MYYAYLYRGDTIMLSLDEIVEKLKDRNLRIVANRIGISYMTVYNIAKQNNTNPSHTTLTKLSDYLK